MTPRKTSETEQTAQAMAEMERYCADHPLSPSAKRHPKLMVRGGNWIALLGSTLEDGIAGIGNTVQTALRAFDAQYNNSSHKPRG
jgi:hypothetical protein